MHYTIPHHVEFNVDLPVLVRPKRTSLLINSTIFEFPTCVHHCLNYLHTLGRSACTVPHNARLLEGLWLAESFLWIKLFKTSLYSNLQIHMVHLMAIAISMRNCNSLIVAHTWYVFLLLSLSYLAFMDIQIRLVNRFQLKMKINWLSKTT